MTQKVKFSTAAAVVASSLMPGVWSAEDATQAWQPPILEGDHPVQTTESSGIFIGDGNAGSLTEVVQSNFITAVFRAEDAWNKVTETRFRKLAVKEALEQLTSEERIELGRLDALREREVSPPSGEEAIRQYRGRQLTAKLLTALQEYVAFFGHAPSDTLSTDTAGTYPEKPKASRQA